MITIGVLGTFEHEAENSAVAARHISSAGAIAVRIRQTDPWPVKIRKLRSVDVVYGTGFGFAWKLYLLARLMGKSTVNHWVGTDVLLALEQPRLRAMARRADRFIGRQLVQAPWLAAELRTIGLRAEVIALTTEISAAPPPPRHREPGVMAYLPDQRAAFYGAEHVYRLAEAYPQLPFGVVAGSGSAGPSLPNVRYHGWVNDLAPLYAAYPILVRLTRHDGLPKMVLEALVSGNQVIFTYDFPHCYQATDFETARAALDRILDAGGRCGGGRCGGCPANLAGRAHVLANYGYENTVGRLLGALGIEPRT